MKDKQSTNSKQSSKLSKLLSKVKTNFKKLTHDKSLLLIVIFALIFSFYLMTRSLSYEDGNIIASPNTFGDFRIHVSLTRSFSEGDNIPPEYPLFAGKNSGYHYMFFFLAGMLEKLGLRIDVAINLLSVISFAGLIIFIYLFSIKITKSKFVGWLAVFMFLFNPTLSWYYYLSDNSFSLTDTLSDVISSTGYRAYGPYSDTLVSIFWNLNVYLNQRHMIFAFFLTFLATWCIFYRKGYKSMFFGTTLIAIMPLFNKAAFIILCMTLGFLSLTDRFQFRRVVLALLIGCLLALPSIFYMQKHITEEYELWNPGFLYDDTSFEEFGTQGQTFNTTSKWLIYWFFNLSFLPMFAFIGWLILLKSKNFKNNISAIRNKRINYFLQERYVWFLVPILLFIITNLFNFSPHQINNHKLMNFGIIILNIYASYFIYSIFNRNIFGKALSVIFIITVTLGGIVDFFIITNDTEVHLADINNVPVSKWVSRNTPTDSNIIALTDNVTPITFTGRKIYLSMEYYPWSVGYHVEERKSFLRSFVTGRLSKTDICTETRANNLKYILLEKSVSDFYNAHIREEYLNQNFTSVYEDSTFKIYSMRSYCYGV